MLVLTRKRGEKIQIGGGITVTVVEIDRGRVKLGIEAPQSVEISRTDRNGETEYHGPRREKNDA